LQDPEAIANWPLTLSRDGARTPMPWQADSPQLGFSTVEPWLPVGRSHRELAVNRQTGSDSSLLQFTRNCLNLRKAHAALHHGSMTIQRADHQLLVFERAAGVSRVRCTINLSDRTTNYNPLGRKIASSGDLDAGVLGPYSAVVEEIS